MSPLYKGVNACKIHYLQWIFTAHCDEAIKICKHKLSDDRSPWFGRKIIIAFEINIWNVSKLKEKNNVYIIIDSKVNKSSSRGTANTLQSRPVDDFLI